MPTYEAVTLKDLETKWEPIFKKKIAEVATSDDPAHDLSHFERVVATAKRLCAEEGADASIVIPAAWLHDLVIVPKNDPRRSQASRLSGEAAKVFLKEIGYVDEVLRSELRDDAARAEGRGSAVDGEKLEAIAHAVEAHSFSANITPRTLEAKIVQDADRLDGLGAIGVARLFITAGLMKRPIYATEDPFAEKRELNDQVYTIDHVYKKLFVVANSLQTEAGKREGARRHAFVLSYLEQLAAEI